VGAIWDCFSAGSFFLSPSPSPTAPFSHETQHPMAAGRRPSRLLLPTPEVGAECWGGRVWNCGVEGLGSWNKRQSQEECVWGEEKDFLDFLGWKGATQLSSGAVCPA
jgi:hypothetical protein